MYQKKVRKKVTDTIDPRSLTAVVVVGVIELETFSISRNVAEAAGNDAWLSIIFGGLLVSLITYLLIRLAMRFPRENFFQYSVRVWSKPVTYVIAIAYFFFWAAYLTVLMKGSVELNSTFFLREAPAAATLIIIQAGAVALVLYGLAAIVRYFQLMFPILLLPLILIFLLSFKDIQADNFLPFLGEGIIPVLKGALIYASAIQGVEVLLFIGPFLREPAKAVRPALLGVNLVNVLILAQVLTAIGILGVKSTQELVWPNVSMLGVLEIPGLPAERFDLLLTLPTIVGVFTTICLVLYLLSYGIVQIFRITNKKLVVISMAIATAAATYLIPNFAWTMKVRSIVNYSTLVFILLIPLLTLIVSILRGKKGEES